MQITAAGAALVVSPLTSVSTAFCSTSTTQVSLSNGRVAFQGTAEEFLESDGYKAVAGGDEDEITPMVSDGKKPPAARKTSSALVPPSASRKSSSASVTPAAAAKSKPRSFAQVAAQATGYESPSAYSTDVTSASEGGEDDSDSDPTIDGDEPKANGKLLSSPPEPEKKPRKLVEEEGRAVGRVSGAVWKLYLGMMGGILFWFCFAVIFAGAKLSDVAQTWWLGVWAGACESAFSSFPVHALLTSFTGSRQPRPSAQHELLPRSLCRPLRLGRHHRDPPVVRPLQRNAARLEQAT